MLTLHLQSHVLKSNGSTEQRLLLGLEVADLSQQPPGLVVHSILHSMCPRYGDTVFRVYINREKGGETSRQIETDSGRDRGSDT